MMDPLCSAVCSLQEIRDMCDLIFEKTRTTSEITNKSRYFRHLLRNALGDRPKALLNIRLK